MFRQEDSNEVESKLRQSHHQPEIFSASADCSICLLEKAEGGELYMMKCCGAEVHLLCVANILGICFAPMNLF